MVLEERSRGKERITAPREERMIMKNLKVGRWGKMVCRIIN